LYPSACARREPRPPPCVETTRPVRNFYTLHPILHPTPYNLRPTPYTLQPTLHVMNDLCSRPRRARPDTVLTRPLSFDLRHRLLTRFLCTSRAVYNTNRLFLGALSPEAGPSRARSPQSPPRRWQRRLDGDGDSSWRLRATHRDGPASGRNMSNLRRLRILGYFGDYWAMTFQEALSTFQVALYLPSR
jgi:hypothetical protein